MKAVLAAPGPVASEHRDPWQHLLVRLVELRSHRLDSTRQQALKQEQAYRGQQAVVVNRLDRLRLLEEYEVRVRRDIERTTAMLMRLTSWRGGGSGSFIEMPPAGRHLASLVR